MRLTIITLTTVILIASIGGLIGYNLTNESELSGVRGGGRTGFWTLDGEDIAIGTSTVTEELTVDGDIYAYGHILVEDVYHAYGGITATSATIALTQDSWATTTNAYNGLWTGDEADGISLSNDIMSFTNGGDYTGSVTISFSGGVGNDYEFRFYDYTQKAQAGYTAYASVGANATYQTVTMPIYLEVTAGDEFVLQVRNITDNDDITITAGLFYIQYLHE
jgi:hypothetical protein